MLLPFVSRHIGPQSKQIREMLEIVGAVTLDEFVEKVIPRSIYRKAPLALTHFPEPLSEIHALRALKERAAKNKLHRSFIGLGYYGTLTPTVILRNILENPSWYTAYTPYQPEISQGRLEALLNYQTLVTELTGLPVANASLLDEATAAAEGMALAVSHYKNAHPEASIVSFFVSHACHPQTIAVVNSRAEALGVEIVVGDWRAETVPSNLSGALVQYPDTFGHIEDFRDFSAKIHERGALLIVATDLLALTILTPPSSFNADIALGSSQRFGVPYGYGGPHAAFFAVKDELKRMMPGRLIGVSRDAQGDRALRLSLQTREQHIRRERATSNICTAQVLLAVMAGMFAVYHGPEGLRAIASQVNTNALRLAAVLKEHGIAIVTGSFFDTIHLKGLKARLPDIKRRALELKINLRYVNDDEITVALDECSADRELTDLLYVISGSRETVPEFDTPVGPTWVTHLVRTGPILQHEVFNLYRSETEFLRYMKRLEMKDLSLTHAMIPLGSCTMKLNATSEMIPVTWPEFAHIHPFAPKEQALGYAEMFHELEGALQDITGFAAVSLQPNAGSQGEYAGLLVIRAYHRSRGDLKRTVCLIPRSAHGTNPASAVMAGMEVVVVECDSEGNVAIEDLIAKADQYADTLAALMVTYPSTHGVFEERIVEIAKIIHDRGGQVYMDGANLNAQVGLCKPREIGADVCHINLHKTFCIPHGGGGPGMGPIGVAEHLAPFLPEHPLVAQGRPHGIGPISAAPWGSASILPISWMYVAMMGASGLTQATAIAILSANYMARRLEEHYPVLYKGAHGYVAHECILDLRPLKKSSGIEAEDVAKRLMDYGFHAPTLSFPVVGTLMIEPTESESKAELDRFIDAMIAIRQEIRDVEEQRADRKNNVLKNAPHTAMHIASSTWDHPYSREQAAFPSPATKLSKFWPAVARIDGVYGDKNLVCTCEPIDSYS
jgi:glycine dehydrogenase